jgi:hypothetical protein
MSTRWAIGLLVGATVGCGIQGPPVAPETIGVAPRLQRDKEREAKEQAAGRAQPPSPPAEGKAPPQEPAGEAEAQGLVPPFDGSVQPSARPSGDVQVKPR